MKIERVSVVPVRARAVDATNPAIAADLELHAVTKVELQPEPAADANADVPAVCGAQGQLFTATSANHGCSERAPASVVISTRSAQQASPDGC